MALTITRSQPNRAYLGCGGLGDLHHGCMMQSSVSSIVESLLQRIKAVLEVPTWY